MDINKIKQDLINNSEELLASEMFYTKGGGDPFENWQGGGINGQSACTASCISGCVSGCANTCVSCSEGNRS